MSMLGGLLVVGCLLGGATFTFICSLLLESRHFSVTSLHSIGGKSHLHQKNNNIVFSTIHILYIVLLIIEYVPISPHFPRYTLITPTTGEFPVTPIIFAQVLHSVLRFSLPFVQFLVRVPTAFAAFLPPVIPGLFALPGTVSSAEF